MPLNKVIDTNGKTFEQVKREIGTFVSLVSFESVREFSLMPFWFEQLGPGKYQLHTFDSMPSDLKDNIKDLGDKFIFQI